VNKQVWLVLIVIGLLYVAQMDHQAIAAEPTTQEYLHSNCLIVSGDSGGPLFDFEGKLIGILDLSIGPELRHPGVWADISRILDGRHFSPITTMTKRCSWDLLTVNVLQPTHSDISQTSSAPSCSHLLVEQRSKFSLTARQPFWVQLSISTRLC